MPTVVSKDELIASIEQMTVLELSELVKALEVKFGVSAAAVASVAVSAGVSAEAAPAVEKTEFTVILTNAGDKKIQVIKEIRVITGLGLKEAKALVDEAPKTVKENISKDEVEAIKKQLEAVGATIEVK